MPLLPAPSLVSSDVAVTSSQGGSDTDTGVHSSESARLPPHIQAASAVPPAVPEKETARDIAILDPTDPVQHRRRRGGGRSKPRVAATDETAVRPLPLPVVAHAQSVAHAQPVTHVQPVVNVTHAEDSGWRSRQLEEDVAVEEVILPPPYTER